jgi:hypothetical protein
LVPGRVPAERAEVFGFDASEVAFWYSGAVEVCVARQHGEHVGRAHGGRLIGEEFRDVGSLPAELAGKGWLDGEPVVGDGGADGFRGDGGQIEDEVDFGLRCERGSGNDQSGSGGRELHEGQEGDGKKCA